jgi:hypothetical protein
MLVGRVAHDFNNLLSGIMNAAEAVGEQPGVAVIGAAATDLGGGGYSKSGTMAAAWAMPARRVVSPIHFSPAGSQPRSQHRCHIGHHPKTRLAAPPLFPHN